MLRIETHICNETNWTKYIAQYKVTFMHAGNRHDIDVPMDTSLAAVREVVLPVLSARFGLNADDAQHEWKCAVQALKVRLYAQLGQIGAAWHVTRGTSVDKLLKTAETHYLREAERAKRLAAHKAEQEVAEASAAERKAERKAMHPQFPEAERRIMIALRNRLREDAIIDHCATSISWWEQDAESALLAVCRRKVWKDITRMYWTTGETMAEIEGALQRHVEYLQDCAPFRRSSSPMRQLAREGERWAYGEAVKIFDRQG
jgi:hypothetical protein